MGLFDHLFKAKSPPGDEKVVEHPPATESVAPAKPVDSPARTPIPQRADPSAFLHPKSFVPRGAPSLTPAPRPSGISAPKPSERRVASAGPPPAADEIVLTLGDVLSRIPAPYLKAGTHDPKRELRFKINDLSSDIARGRAAVPLSRIAELVPDIFIKEISREEDTEVRLPLQKLVEQIGLLRSRPKVAPVLGDKATRPAASADGTSVPRIVDVEVKKESTSASAGTAPAVPVGERFRSVVPSPHAPPIILGEQAFAGQRAVELKPAAEAPPPVILGPASPVEPPPAAAPVPLAPVSAPPAIPTPAPVAATPAPVIAAEPISAPAAEPTRAEAPSAPVAAPAVVVPPPSVEEPEPEPPAPAASSIPEILPAAVPKPRPATAARPGIVIDWSSESPVAVPPIPPEANVSEPKAPEAKVTESTVEPVPPAVAQEVRKLTPLEATEVESSEEKIHLSLAAILRHCPQDIIVGELPHVDDSVRITLPFAPIDRQLVKGQVEVSALRFVASLPEAYHKYFVAKVGVKVPIPLEEVFQNLPSPKHELTSVAPVPPPTVLAPASAIAAPVAPLASIPAPIAPEAAPALAVSDTRSPSTLAGATQESQAAPAAEPVDAAGIPFSIFKPVSPSPATEPMAPAPASVSVDVPSAPVTPADAGESGAVPPPLPTVATPEIPALAASVDAPPLVAAAMDMPAAEIPTAPKLEPQVSTAEAAAEVIPQEAVPASAAGEPAPTSTAGEEPPKLVLQRPVFRPFAMPPPIFGFAPPASSTPAEPSSPVEQPPLISGLNEAAVPVIESKDGALATGPTPVSVEPVAPPPDAEIDAAPTPEMIASALEDGAPETILPFPVQPAPFADLAETLAHETTYAPELAEVVHVDVPVQESGEKPIVAEVEAQTTGESGDQKVAPLVTEPVVAEQLVARAEPVVVEQPAASAEPVIAGQPAAPAEPVIDEHPAAPAEPVISEKPVSRVRRRKGTVADALAAAAAAAAAAEALSHKEHKPDETELEEIVARQKEAPAPTVEPVAEPAAPTDESKVEEPVQPEQLVAEVVTAPVEIPFPTPTEAQAAPTPEPPVAPEPTPAAVPEPPAAAVPPSPPPIPLFPLPKVSVEHAAHLEILPPSLPLRRFDQDAVQALFMTEETLDLPKISRLAASLPGVYACVIATRDQACTGGTLPDGFDLAALLGLAPRVGEAAGRMPIGQLKHFTLYGDAYSVSFFERNGLSLCAVHRPRSFVPGVREKLVALADELSR